MSGDYFGRIEQSLGVPTEQKLLQVLDKMEQERKRGWNEGIEAAAELMESRDFLDADDYIAAAIRKLKKS